MNGDMKFLPAVYCVPERILNVKCEELYRQQVAVHAGIARPRSETRLCIPWVMCVAQSNARSCRVWFVGFLPSFRLVGMLNPLANYLVFDYECAGVK